MTSLVASLSTGKGTWSHVAQLIKAQQWDSVFLVTNEFGKENFGRSSDSASNLHMIVVGEDQSVADMARTITTYLEGKISDLEVALNLVSGTGKEHMAIMSALVKMGMGLRFVVVTEKGVEEV